MTHQMHPHKPLVIYNQLGDEVDLAVRRHWSQPEVRRPQPGDIPWDLPGDIDVLLARPFLGWAEAPRQKPTSWPGSLKWVLTGSTGVDFFPPWLLDAPLVTCGRGVNADPIAEYVMGAILRHAKRYEVIRMRGPDDFRRIELDGLDGKVLGLAGFGALGQAIAPRGLAFGMKILAFKRTPWRDVVADVEPVESFGDLVGRADHLVLALPSTPETRHIVDAATLARAKPGQHLINIARGALIDQDALIEALDAGQLAAATLDVTEPEPLAAGHPLYAHDKILVTPHVSWLSASNGPRLATKIVEALDRFVRGEPQIDVVDPVTGY